MGAWTGLIWPGIGLGVGFYDCGNEPPDSMYCGEFCDCLGCIAFSRTVLCVVSYIETCY